MDWLDEIDLANGDTLICDEFLYGHDADYPEDDWYEDQDALEMGFDPYMGCYSDDC